MFIVYREALNGILNWKKASTLKKINPPFVLLNSKYLLQEVNVEKIIIKQLEGLKWFYVDPVS